MRGIGLTFSQAGLLPSGSGLFIGQVEMLYRDQERVQAQAEASGYAPSMAPLWGIVRGSNIEKQGSVTD